MTLLASFFGWGDSNMANSDGFTYHERALAALDIPHAWFRCCSAGQALASGTSVNVLDLIEGHRIAIIAMGTNNFGQAIGTTLPLLQAAITAFRAQGIEKVLACTMPPSTTSTDSYATAANQSPHDGSATQSTNRLALNNAIRAMVSSPGGGNADAVSDAASYVEVNASNLFTIDGERWAIKTAPGIGTVGTHGTGPHYEDRGMAAAAVGQALAIDRLLDGETGFVQVNPDLGT